MINTRFKARSSVNLPDLWRVAETAAAPVKANDSDSDEEDQLRSQRSHSFSTIPHEGLTYKNETWLCAQSAIMTAFKGEPIKRLTAVLVSVRGLGKSEVGPFIYDFYKNQMLKKGMMIIKGDLQEFEGRSLIAALENAWTRFYHRTLNDIKLILYQIQVQQKRFNIEQVTLMAFKKRIVMKTKIRSALLEMRSDGEEPGPVLQQMFSVLQGLTESHPPTECDLQFERLTALALSPYLGHRGLYFGGEEPLYLAAVEFHRRSPRILPPDVPRILPPDVPRYVPRQMSQDCGGSGSLARRLKERRRKQLGDSPLIWSKSLEVVDIDMKA